MSYTRVIPRLDIKGPNLVKGVHLEGLRVLGKPEDFARYYYENGADELIFQDVVASLYDRNSLHDIISRTAEQTFIPLTVGGGLRTTDDIKSVLRAGADKVSLNTAAIKNPEIIKQASRMFGSSTIVVSIEAIKERDGRYLCYTDNGRDYTGVDALEWAKQVQDLGAGEIVITSVDQEGTGLGFNLELTKMITDELDIPVIAHGGAKNAADCGGIIKDGGADAVAVASIFHYEFIQHSSRLKSEGDEGNVEFLSSGRAPKHFTPMTIDELKAGLNNNGVPTRV